LKQETLDYTLWRTHFQRGYGSLDLLQDNRMMMMMTMMTIIIVVVVVVVVVVVLY
jgi:heme/copper-type cytochrome/quinol oxidase subunit 2